MHPKKIRLKPVLLLYSPPFLPSFFKREEKNLKKNSCRTKQHTIEIHQILFIPFLLKIQF